MAKRSPEARSGARPGSGAHGRREGTKSDMREFYGLGFPPAPGIRPTSWPHGFGSRRAAGARSADTDQRRLRDLIDIDPAAGALGRWPWLPAGAVRRASRVSAGSPRPNSPGRPCARQPKALPCGATCPWPPLSTGSSRPRPRSPTCLPRRPPVRRTSRRHGCLLVPAGPPPLARLAAACLCPPLLRYGLRRISVGTCADPLAGC